MEATPPYVTKGSPDSELYAHLWPDYDGNVPKDSFNREIDYLRLSVTDRCNLRCVYCMPLEGLRFLPNAELIQPAEYEMVARAAVSVGFHKFRLTGGEPLLRLDIVELVA